MTNCETDPTEAERKAFWASHDHRHHATGCPPSTAWQEAFAKRPKQRIEELTNRLPACGLMDMAWLVMLHEQGLVDRPTVAKLAPVLRTAHAEKGFGGEAWIKQQLPDHDEDVASAVNYGRTLQEPMGRMQMREGLLYVLQELHETRSAFLAIAEANVETVMAGHSHRAHAQPTTWGAYLLAVHDQLARGEEQLDLAYRHTNVNTGGCGACSGTGWPVDRNRITELLGFDATVELTYDCEGSMDEHMTILFAAANLAITLGRTAFDHNVWVTEEWNIFTTDLSFRGVSSFMPQKAHPGSMFERVRIMANDVLGQMQTALFNLHNEAIQDVLPVYQSEEKVIRGLACLEGALALFRTVLAHTYPNRERMRELLRAGYSGAPDLAMTLIREKGYGGRAAHRICATMVRIARERGIEPSACDAALLREAARISDDPEPDITDEAVQEAMGLENFFLKHDNLGDPNPTETRRLVDVRRRALEEVRSRHAARRRQIDEAFEKLKARIDEIAGE